MTETNPPHDPNQPPQQPPASSYPGAQPPPYPGTGHEGGYGGPGGPPVAAPQRPAPVRTAVLLMVVGAVLSAVSIVVGLATMGDARAQVREQLEAQGDEATPQIVDAAVGLGIALVVVIGVVSVLLWLWMAWKNGQGRAWARVVATVLAGLNLLFTLLQLAGGTGEAQAASMNALDYVLSIVGLVIAVVVVGLLWSKPARAYFDEVGARRAAERYVPGR